MLMLMRCTTAVVLMPGQRLYEQADMQGSGIMIDQGIGVSLTVEFKGVSQGNAGCLGITKLQLSFDDVYKR